MGSRSGAAARAADGPLTTNVQAVVSRSKTRRGNVPVRIFLLLPELKLAERLNLARATDWASDSVLGLIVAHWEEVVLT